MLLVSQRLQTQGKFSVTLVVRKHVDGEEIMNMLFVLIPLSSQCLPSLRLAAEAHQPRRIGCVEQS